MTDACETIPIRMVAVPSHPFDDLNREDVLTLMGITARLVARWIQTYGPSKAQRHLQETGFPVAAQTYIDTAWGG